MGLTYLSGTDDILAGMVAQKSFFLGPPRSPLELKLKAHADYNTQTQQARWAGDQSHPVRPSPTDALHAHCLAPCVRTCTHCTIVV